MPEQHFRTYTCPSRRTHNTNPHITHTVHTHTHTHHTHTHTCQSSAWRIERLSFDGIKLVPELRFNDTQSASPINGWPCGHRDRSIISMIKFEFDYAHTHYYYVIICGAIVSSVRCWWHGPAPTESRKSGKIGTIGKKSGQIGTIGTMLGKLAQW